MCKLCNCTIFGQDRIEFFWKWICGVQCRGRVVQSSIAHTPFQNHSFDVVTSFEVLEHISEVDVPDSCQRLAHLTKGPLFLTISQRLSKLDDRENPTVHVTVKPREYWDRQFAAVGCTPDFYRLKLLLRYYPSYCKPNFTWKMGISNCAMRGQTSLLEKEPWFFIYNCNGSKQFLKTNT